MSKATDARGPTLTRRSATQILNELPETFTYTQARRAGLDHRSLYGLRDTGTVEVLGRGVYRRLDAQAADPILAEVAVRAPQATVCLTSALAQHDLTDAILPMPDLALPRGHRFPTVSGPVSWHAFAVDTFDLGREDLDVAPGLQIGLYDAERTLVDTFRMRHRQGEDEAYEALRRWLRRLDSQPSTLLAMAAHFPRTVTPIRQALTVLL